METVIIDSNKKVRMPIERGAGLIHKIKIQRRYEGAIELLYENEIRNGPQNKVTLDYNSLTNPSQYLLSPTYKRDGSWRPSRLKTVQNNNGGLHRILNFTNDGSDDDFDLQIQVFIS